MAKDEEEEVGKGDARRAREGGFGSVRNVEGGRRRGGGACGEPVRCPGRGWKGAKAPAEDERRRKGRKRQRDPDGLAPSLCPFAHRHRGFTRVSPVSHPKFPVLPPPPSGSESKGERADAPPAFAGKRESDAEDDAGAAKLDTSPAVLSPSFILRTFYRLPR